MRDGREGEMFNSTTLEVAIGLALIYLLLSLFCTAINEAIAGFLGSRARNLEKGIQSLFTEGKANQVNTDGATNKALSLADAIYNHGLIQSLYRSGSGSVAERDVKNLPSYIPSRVFASALLDIVFPDNKANPTGLPKTLSEMLDKLKLLPESKGKDAIMTLVLQANGDIVKTRQAFEHWFDDGMDRAAGWYKRKTQFVLFCLGFIIACTLNVDSITVGSTLWATPALRSYSIAVAEKDAKEHSLQPSRPGAAVAAGAPQAAAQNTHTDTDNSGLNDRLSDPSADLDKLQSLNLPIGWGTSSAPWLYKGHSDPWHWVGLLFALIGWLLTGIAVTLGAPFWFDALNQFMVIRSTIKPREKSEVEPSKN